MDHKIITPQAMRILCDGVSIFPLAGTAAGNKFTSSTYCAAVNGDACFFFWGANGFGTPLIPLSFLRVKANGQFCWYSTGKLSDIITTHSYNFSSAYKISPNQFYFTYNVYGYNVSAYLTVPEYFVPNGFVHIAVPIINFPPAPCGSGAVLNTIYFANGNDALLEYIQSFPLAYNLWAASAKVSPSGFSVINGGFCGNFNNGIDPLYSNTISLYSNYQFGFSDGFFSYDHNGNLIYRDVEFKDLFGNFLVVGGASIKSGNLNCAGTGAFPLYSNSLAYSYYSQDKVFNGFTFKSNFATNLHAETDLEVSAACNFYSAMQLFNGPQFVELAGAPGACLNGVYLKDSNVWIASSNGTAVYINTPRAPVPIFNPTPVTSGIIGHQLVNFHRPVSVLGRFKT